MNVSTLLQNGCLFIEGENIRMFIFLTCIYKDFIIVTNIATVQLFEWQARQVAQF